MSGKQQKQNKVKIVLRYEIVVIGNNVT